MHSGRPDDWHGSSLLVRPPAPRRGGLESPKNVYLDIKSFVDMVLASLLLAALAPVILIAAVLVRTTSHGPAFYRQVRTGRYGRRFLIYKLRTMYEGSERDTGPVWSSPDDRRVTPIGSLLRRTHIDEFPQLWNVLRGEMALVGPRPERPEIIVKLERAVPSYRDRLAVRPGLSGLAQIFLPPDAAVDDVRRKLAYDLLYVSRIGPRLDFLVCFCTAAFLLGVPFRVSRRLLGLGATGLMPLAPHGSPAGTKPIGQVLPT